MLVDVLRFIYGNFLYIIGWIDFRMVLSGNILQHSEKELDYTLFDVRK